MNALVEDYFRQDELTQMEAEAIRHNITGSDTEVLENREFDEVPRELISNHRRLCRVKNMLTMYLKYHKAGLTPTTPVTSTAISAESYPWTNNQANTEIIT